MSHHIIITSRYDRNGSEIVVKNVCVFCRCILNNKFLSEVHTQRNRDLNEQLN